MKPLKYNVVCRPVTRQQPVNSSVVSEEWVSGVSEKLVGELVSKLGTCWGSACDLLLLEAGRWDREQFGNPEEGERPPLEAVTRRRVKTQQAEKF
jgi:hypothetical protein